MKILARLFVSAISIFVTTHLLKGIYISDFTASLLAALILAIINITLKPLLILLTLPINILTLGLFTIIINASLVLLTAAIVPGFSIDNFGWAILFSIILAIVNYILNKLID